VRVVLVFGSRARGEARLDSDLDLAVIVHQPQLTPAEKVDLVVAGSEDAERLSGSRWHVFGDVAKEGRVLYVAR
jgi:predicted nucleotidyltransferase